MTGDALVSEPIRMRAHAKLTLSLRVLGTRGDGYHELEALAVSLEQPADQVEVALRGDGRFTLQIAGATDDVPLDDDNLAASAAKVLLRRVEPGAGARLRLRKVIPAGSGLGGASADAAAVLAGLARLLPTETAGVDLADLGATLGSDVPFCVSGGAAWMRGRGEVLAPAPTIPEGLAVVVAVPSLRLSTPEVYARWDALGGPEADRSIPAPTALRELTPELANDLEPAAIDLEPALADFRDLVDRAVGPPLLAGSGSAYAALFDGLDDAAEAAEGLRAELGGQTVLVVASGVAPSGVSEVA